MIDACVGNQNVEVAMTFDDSVDGSLCGMMISHVERRGLGIQSATAECRHSRFERVHVAAIKCDDRASSCETFGHSEAKSARGAGNECNASVK